MHAMEKVNHELSEVQNQPLKNGKKISISNSSQYLIEVCDATCGHTWVAGFSFPVVHTVAVEVVEQVDAPASVLTGVPVALVHIWNNRAR